MSSDHSRSHSSTGEIKYARGTGARVPASHRPLRAIEWAVLIHVGLLFVGTTWAFGGAGEWLRPIIAWWGSLGALLTLTALQDREAWRDGWMKPLWWLLPFLAFNALTLVACLTPNLREIRFGLEVTLAPHLDVGAALPSSARPALALHSLWLFDALWISCFNLTLVLRQRRAIRGFLLLMGANALALSIFGTVQKLSAAKGIYFDAFPVKQTYFFATFVYHNHWGAFAVLSTAICLGLVWHYARRRDTQATRHSPALAGFVVVLLLAATVPLSGSRSSSLLVAALLAAAFLQWTYRLVQKRRRFRESVALPLSGAFLAVALGLAGIWYVARDTILARVEITREQVGTMRSEGTIGSRVALYGDTWRMAAAKPWFGWGSASYPHVFRFYNSREWDDRTMPHFYRDAHSDWLQSLAEHGFVGSACLALCVILPLARLRPRHLASPVPVYLLAGCALILLYAWVEFPFGNVAVVLSWWLCFFSAVHYARLYDHEAPAPVKSASASA